VSYLIFINANFGAVLSKQHKILYDMVHFDLIENVNEYLFKVRKYEDAYFWKGKISYVGVSGFLSSNAGLEFIPLILILSITSVLFILKKLKNGNKNNVKSYSKKQFTRLRSQKMTDREIAEKVNKKHSWINRLNNMRFGLILSSVIEYWLFSTVNLTKGLMFENCNFWESFCHLASVTLLCLFVKEGIDMAMLLKNTNFPKFKHKLTSEEEKIHMEFLQQNFTEYEKTQFKALTDEQELHCMDNFFCRNFMLISVSRILAFTIVLVTLMNFPIGQLIGLMIFSIPFSVILVYKIMKDKFIKSRVKSVAYIVEEVCLTVVLFCAAILVFRKNNGSLKLNDYKIFSSTIGYAVIIAVIVEILSTLILAI
jgi:hypothetical protein